MFHSFHTYCNRVWSDPDDGDKDGPWNVGIFSPSDTTDSPRRAYQLQPSWKLHILQKLCHETSVGLIMFLWQTFSSLLNLYRLTCPSNRLNYPLNEQSTYPSDINKSTHSRMNTPLRFSFLSPSINLSIHQSVIVFSSIYILMIELINQSINPFIYPSVDPSIRPSTHLPIWFAVKPINLLVIHPSISNCFCLSTYPHMFPSLRLLVFPAIRFHLSLYYAPSHPSPL
jgi:hypothetical protein